MAFETGRSLKEERPTIGSSYAGEELPCAAVPQPAAFHENVKRRNFLLGNCRCHIEPTRVMQERKTWRRAPPQTKTEPLQTSVNGTELKTSDAGQSRTADLRGTDLEKSRRSNI